MQALLKAIITWLSVNYGLPANYDVPNVRFSTPLEITSIRYGGLKPQRHREARAAYDAGPADQRYSTVAIYDDQTKTIILPVGWQGESPAELSVLVHELVHHLQTIAGSTYACPQEREALAYDAQNKWLGLFGRSLASEFKIDAMTLLVRTKCL
jgi:Domain of unknown function (DUF6647)